MNYIKRESVRYDKEHEKLAKPFMYGIVIPAVLAGSFGWGCYFANKYEDPSKYKKNVSSASEAKK